MLTDESSVAAIGRLTESDALARLKADGYNELPRPGRHTPFRIVWGGKSQSAGPGRTFALLQPDL
jgi:hypothetical protein